MAGVDHRISAHPCDLVAFEPIAFSGGAGEVLPILREHRHAIENPKLKLSGSKKSGTRKRFLKVDVTISAKIKRYIVQIFESS